jgi:hypothetical protein
LIQVENDLAQDFAAVETKLEKLRNFNKVNRKRLNLGDPDRESPQVLFYLLCFLVQICRVLHVDDLRQLIGEIFAREVEQETYDQAIAFACASGILERVGDEADFLAHSNDASPFIEIQGVQDGRITAAAVEFYSEHFPHLLDLAGEISS